MSSDLSVGIIGAGVMGRCYAKALHEYGHARLVGVCDLDAGRAASLAGEFGATAAASIDELLLLVDAVVVATPDFAHREPVVACLDARKAVLCEKPLATTEADCAAICEAVDRTGRPFMVNYGNRHRSSALRLKQTLADGEIGTPQYVYIRLNERLAKTFELSWLERTSPVWFLMSHCADLVSWALEDRFATVTGRAMEGSVAERVPGVPDICVALATTESGVNVVLETAWNLPEGFAPNIDFFVQIIGDRGAIQVDLVPHDLNVFSDAARSVDHSFDVPGPRGHGAGWWQESVRYFVDAVLDGNPLHPSADEAASVSRFLMAVETSIAEGRAVNVT